MDPENVPRTCASFLLLGLVSASFTQALLVSMAAPLFPILAVNKGASPAEYGSAFGAYHLAACIFAPVWARLRSFVGPKMIYAAAFAAQGIVGGLAFSLLDNFEDHTLFMFFSYLIRFLHGAIQSACFGSLLSIAVMFFPRKSATVVSACEGIDGLGCTLGPLLAAYLSGVGGYQLPFRVSGSLVILNAFLILVTVPKTNPVTIVKELPDKIGAKNLSFVNILTNIPLWHPLVDQFWGQFIFGFTDAMLGPHANEAAGMTQGQVGSAFLLVGMAYMIGSFLTGLHVDKIEGSLDICWTSAFGFFVATLSLSLMGPPSGLPLEPSPALIYPSAALSGLSGGVFVMSTFARISRAIRELGFTSANDAHFVQGLWLSSYYIGNFLGATASGAVVQTLGFRMAATLLAGLFICLAILDLLSACLSMPPATGCYQEVPQK